MSHGDTSVFKYRHSPRHADGINEIGQGKRETDGETSKEGEKRDDTREIELREERKG